MCTTTFQHIATIKLPPPTPQEQAAIDAVLIELNARDQAASALTAAGPTESLPPPAQLDRPDPETEGAS